MVLGSVQECTHCSGPRVTPLPFGDALVAGGAPTQVQVLSVRRLAPPPAIGTLLQLPQGEPAVQALRLRKSGTLALMLIETWLPESLGHNITPVSLKTQSTERILLDQGVRFGKIVQEVSAELTDPTRAKAAATSFTPQRSGARASDDRRQGVSTNTLSSARGNWPRRPIATSAAPSGALSTLRSVPRFPEN